MITFALTNARTGEVEEGFPSVPVDIPLVRSGAISLTANGRLRRRACPACCEGGEIHA